MFTYDAPKKWYFAHSEYTLVRIGARIVLAYRRNNLTDVRSMNLNVRLSTNSLAMDELIVKLTEAKSRAGLNRFVTPSVECGRGVTKPLWNFHLLSNHTTGVS